MDTILTVKEDLDLISESDIHYIEVKSYNTHLLKAAICKIGDTCIV